VVLARVESMSTIQLTTCSSTGPERADKQHEERINHYTSRVPITDKDK